MKEIRLSIECFDIEAFFNKTIEFLKSQVSLEVHPTYAVVWVQSVGDVPVFGPESGRDVLAGLKKEGKMVFFPFAHSDVDGTLTCADGNTYRPASKDGDNEEAMLIGLEDSIGYLVQIKDGDFIANSAIHAGGGCTGPPPSVDLHPDCGVLEEPMDRFIRGFVKGQD